MTLRLPSNTGVMAPRPLPGVVSRRNRLDQRTVKRIEASAGPRPLRHFRSRSRRCRPTRPLAAASQASDSPCPPNAAQIARLQHVSKVLLDVRIALSEGTMSHSTLDSSNLSGSVTSRANKPAGPAPVDPPQWSSRHRPPRRRPPQPARRPCRSACSRGQQRPCQLRRTSPGVRRQTVPLRCGIQSMEHAVVGPKAIIGHASRLLLADRSRRTGERHSSSGPKCQSRTPPATAGRPNEVSSRTADWS